MPIATTSAPDVVYLDNAASTACDPRVVDVLVDHHRSSFANAGATWHEPGRRAAEALRQARLDVQELVAGSSLAETATIFTSGATEANNLMLAGIAAMARETRRWKVVVSAIEHKSVLAPVERLTAQGFHVVTCGVDGDGVLDLEELAQLVDERTLLVSVQLANNELGTLQPVDAVASIAREHGAFVHTDAAQAAGKVPVDLGVLDVDAITLSGHKFHGPKGTGALVLRSELVAGMQPIVAGGGQELGLRSGTHDVPGLAGLGMAARIATHELEGELRRIATLRLHFEDLLAEQVPGIRVNAARAPRVPGICNVTLPGSSSKLVLALASGVAAGTGSACSGGGPSPVLDAIGMDPCEAARSVRFSLGRFTTVSDIERAASRIGAAWRRAGSGLAVN